LPVVLQAQLPLDEPAQPAVSGLTQWNPASWAVAPDWQPLIDAFLAEATGLALAGFVQQRLLEGAKIYPPQPLAALALTPLHRVRVVILGQDPYHGAGQAEGLAFSVTSGQRLPPSLQNIFKELAQESGAGRLPARPALRPDGGSLKSWARQGVLLLNTCLTVEEGQPASHAGRGWETLVQSLIGVVAASPGPVVFMLWGTHAQKYRTLIAEKSVNQHLVLCANHPSPLSARRAPAPFLGCGHFWQANAFLGKHDQTTIDW
jgi:uracil-DNA glycosylase